MNIDMVKILLLSLAMSYAVAINTLVASPLQ